MFFPRHGVNDTQDFHPQDHQGPHPQDSQSKIPKFPIPRTTKDPQDSPESQDLPPLAGQPFFGREGRAHHAGGRTCPLDLMPPRLTAGNANVPLLEVGVA